MERLGEGGEYWMEWQVPVCGFIILIPTLVALNFIKKTITKTSSSLLWLPCWRNLSPKFLLFYRAFAFLSMAFLLYQMVQFAGLFAFYFYTQWTFTLVMFYFLVGTIVSAQGCFSSCEKVKDKQTNSLQHQQAGVLGSLMLIIYQISAGASVLTDLVFWCILVPMMAGKQFEMTLLIGCIHSLNAVFLMIDSIMNEIPFEWSGFNYFILWSATYVTYQWIIHAFGVTWWPYPFLDLSTPWAPLWYLALAFIHLPCYALYLFFVKSKNYFFPKLFPQHFVIRLQHQKAA